MKSAGGGKRKGAAFEREICKKLSLWISKGERTDIFWRSAMSGGRATVQFKKGIKNKTQACDISAIDPLGEKLLKDYIIECKHYKNLNLENLIYNTSKEGLLEFWNETWKKAVDLGKLPIVIARQNNKKDIICLNYDIGLTILKHCGIYNISFFRLHGLCILYLHDFLKEQVFEVIGNPRI